MAAEQTGADVRASFPALYQHLQTCAPCRALYDRVKVGMQNAGPWQRAETVSIRIVNDRPLAKSSPWEIIYPAKKGARATQAKVLFQSFHIQKQAIQIAVTRGKENASEILLLSDQITLDHQPIFVQAWLTRDAEQENYVTVRVTMQGPAALTRNASAALVWGKQRYAGVFKRGQAKLERIEAADLDAPLSLTFDFPTPEPPRRASRSHPKPTAAKRAATAKRVTATKPAPKAHTPRT
ncbi:MAG: hypothetical protein HY780_11030 [Chloroflexi bacterium]|nr:hypothetical protein [Chloroflexota bacterium]